jgi:hypothetical protein
MGTPLAGGADRVQHRSSPFRVAPDSLKGNNTNNGKSIAENKPALIRRGSP